MEVCDETKIHIDSVNGGVRMRICLDCAALKFDPTIHVGILKKQDAVDYALNNRREDGDHSFSEFFLQNGMVVIDPKTNTSAQGTLGFLTNILQRKLLESNQGMDLLKHILKQIQLTQAIPGSNFIHHQQGII